MPLDKSAVRDAYRNTAKDRRMAFYGSQISPTRIQAEEGYILYTGVPIARTGSMEYDREEVGLDGEGTVNVYRDAADVFEPAAIASFEGKIVTDEHPPVMLDEQNVMRYIKGTVHNVRRGTGDEADMLIADLMIYDPELNWEIREGKREVSAGYYLEYEEGPDGKLYQKRIRGNHVAIVPKGRAGARVAIKDQTHETKTGGTKMAEKKSLLGRFFATAKDADPEEVAEVARVLAAHETAQEETPAAPPAAAEEKPAAEKDSVAELLAAVKMLLEKMEEKHAAKEGTLEELADEGGEYDPEDDENGVTVVTDEDMEEEEEEEPGMAVDSAKVIARDMLPILNAIPDANARRKAKDALYKSLVKSQGVAKGGAAARANKATADAARANHLDNAMAEEDAIIAKYNRCSAQYKGSDK